MLHTHFHHHHHFLFSNLPISLTHHYSSFSHPSSPLLHFLHRPTIPHTVSVSAIPPAAELTKIITATEELGTIFAAMDDPSAIQVSSTVVVTAVIAVFVFPSLQRRIKRAKQLKYRSSGVKKPLDGSKVMGPTSIKAKNKATPDQALLGAIIAGVIAVILYRFTTSIEAALYRQTVSDNFSVRQITITIRTVINGLCYLATFVYGINSVGLLLYSGQLAMNTYVGGSSGKKTESKITEKSCLSNSSVENLSNNNNLSSTKDDQSSNNSL